jgi:uncharacterized protein with PQ loop repeat
MNFLDFIPEYVFEFVGLIAGFGASFVIAIQVYKEHKSDEPSSLSLGYLLGWGGIFIFWGLYGVRFDALALWLTNGIAVILQTILCVVIIKKSRASQS